MTALVVRLSWTVTLQLREIGYRNFGSALAFSRSVRQRQLKVIVDIVNSAKTCQNEWLQISQVIKDKNGVN